MEGINSTAQMMAKLEMVNAPLSYRPIAPITTQYGRSAPLPGLKSAPITEATPQPRRASQTTQQNPFADPPRSSPIPGRAEIFFASGSPRISSDRVELYNNSSTLAGGSGLRKEISPLSWSPFGASPGTAGQISSYFEPNAKPSGSSTSARDLLFMPASDEKSKNVSGNGVNSSATSRPAGENGTAPLFAKTETSQQRLPFVYEPPTPVMPTELSLKLPSLRLEKPSPIEKNSDMVVESANLAVPKGKKGLLPADDPSLPSVNLLSTPSPMNLPRPVSPLVISKPNLDKQLPSIPFANPSSIIGRTGSTSLTRSSSSRSSKVNITTENPRASFRRNSSASTFPPSPSTVLTTFEGSSVSGTYLQTPDTQSLPSPPPIAVYLRPDGSPFTADIPLNASSTQLDADKRSIMSISTLSSAPPSPHPNDLVPSPLPPLSLSPPATPPPPPSPSPRPSWNSELSYEEEHASADGTGLGLELGLGLEIFGGGSTFEGDSMASYNPRSERSGSWEDSQMDESDIEPRFLASYDRHYDSEAQTDPFGDHHIISTWTSPAGSRPASSHKQPGANASDSTDSQSPQKNPSSEEPPSVPSTAAHSVPSFTFSRTPSPPSSPPLEPPLLSVPEPAHPARGLTYSLLTTEHARRDKGSTVDVRRSPAQSAASSFGGSEYASAYEGASVSRGSDDNDDDGEEESGEEGSVLDFDDIEAMKPRGVLRLNRLNRSSTITAEAAPHGRPLFLRAIPPPLNLEQSSQSRLAPLVKTSASASSSASEMWSPRSSAYASAFGGSDAGDAEDGEAFDEDDDDEMDEEEENEVTLVGTEVGKSMGPDSSLHSTPMAQFRDHRQGLVAT
ncbi:hypothetical protein BOTBODRAFT_65572 [Botryobasidium botryosum FD-172 SS1]|uniref:Uncharacterized protein n=1 Tax=Botryobasidium botryosum (strain FD-172 SS1) TaxID=930990 RepID=A0A067MIC7_BOTB1|nr:hypothetical protein BOTBODRAFT_65572 [Botryobasidium botryosum FD-172 SS1]